MIAARENPTPILNKSIGLVISGLIKIRKSLEEQPHTRFVMKEKSGLKSESAMVVTPPPFRHKNLNQLSS